MTFLIIILSILVLSIVVINAEYNRAAKTPGTKIYEGKRFYNNIK